MYHGACIFIIDQNGLVLAVSRKNDKQDFGLPGGKVEAGEQPLDAAIRELQEETGLVADPAKVVPVYQSNTDGKLAITFAISIENVTGKIRSSEEGEVRWVKPEVLTRGTFAYYNKGLLNNLKIPF